MRAAFCVFACVFSCFSQSHDFLRVIASPVTAQPVAQVKPPVVAEWGSGVTPRHDPDTISKHVKQMVDVSTVVTLQLQERPFHFLLGR